MGGGGLGSRVGQAGAPGGIGSMGNPSQALGAATRPNEGPAGIATQAPPFRPPSMTPGMGPATTPPMSAPAGQAGAAGTQDFDTALAYADGRLPMPPGGLTPAPSSIGGSIPTVGAPMTPPAKRQSVSSTPGAPVSAPPASTSMSPAASAEQAMLDRAGIKSQRGPAAPPFRPPSMTPGMGGQTAPSSIGANVSTQRKPAPKPRVQPKPMA